MAGLESAGGAPRSADGLSALQPRLDGYTVRVALRVPVQFRHPNSKAFKNGRVPEL